MASGYKRDSRGRFAGGYGSGALGGKGAYSGRQSRGGGGSKGPKRGRTSRIGMPKGIKLSAKNKARLKKTAINGALAGVGYAGATYAMNRAERSLRIPPSGRVSGPNNYRAASKASEARAVELPWKAYRSS